MQSKTEEDERMEKKKKRRNGKNKSRRIHTFRKYEISKTISDM